MNKEKTMDTGMQIPHDWVNSFRGRIDSLRRLTDSVKQVATDMSKPNYSAYLSAVQLNGICAQGARVDIALPYIAEGIYPYRRAFIHLNWPASINAFFDALLNPSAIHRPAGVQRKGFATPQKVVVFGFLHCKNGDFLVSHFAPGQLD